MPLWAPCDRLLKSNIADVNHIAEGSHAGSVMAALFLKRFVTDAKRFAQLDIFGWVRASSLGGRKVASRKRRRCSPIPQGIRAVMGRARTRAATSRWARRLCADMSRRHAGSRACPARSKRRRCPCAVSRASTRRSIPRRCSARR